MKVLWSQALGFKKIIENPIISSPLLQIQGAEDLLPSWSPMCQS